MAGYDMDGASYDDDFGKFIPLDKDAKMCICDTLGIEYIHNGNIKYPRDLLPLGTPCTRANVQDDGNCFYRAISKAVSNTENNHVKIRSKLAAYLKRLGAGDAARVGQLNSRVGGLEVEAMANLLQLRIYTCFLGNWSCTHNKPHWDRSIYLVNEREYYDLVQCVQSPDGSCNTCDHQNVVSSRYGSPIPLRWSDNKGRRALGRGPVGVTRRAYGVDLAQPAAMARETNAEPMHDEERGFPPVSSEEELYARPWTVLSTTWAPFLAYLGDCWWDDISLPAVVEYMNASVAGDIMIAASTSTDPGTVCSVFVRTKDSIVNHNITLWGCKYKCCTVTDASFPSAIDCVWHIVSTVPRAVILSRGQTDRLMSSTLFGAPVQVHTLCRAQLEIGYVYGKETKDKSTPAAMIADEIAALPNSEHTFRRANKVTGEHITLPDIVKCVSQRQYFDGVVFYNENRDLPGYLFDIVTADAHGVVTFTFSPKAEYVVEVNGEKHHHPTIASLTSGFNMFFLHNTQLGVRF